MTSLMRPAFLPLDQAVLAHAKCLQFSTLHCARSFPALSDRRVANQLASVMHHIIYFSNNDEIEQIFEQSKLLLFTSRLAASDQFVFTLFPLFASTRVYSAR